MRWYVIPIAWQSHISLLIYSTFLSTLPSYFCYIEPILTQLNLYLLLLLLMATIWARSTHFCLSSYTALYWTPRTSHHLHLPTERFLVFIQNYYEVLARQHHVLLAPLPHLSRLSLEQNTGPMFTEDHWRFIPAMIDLKVTKMRDTAIIDLENNIPKNLIRVYATNIMATGSLLRYVHHPIEHISSQLLLDTLRDTKTKFQFNWHDFITVGLSYLPPTTTSICYRQLELSPSMLAPFLNKEPPTGALKFHNFIPPSLATISLRCHDSHLDRAKFLDIDLNMTRNSTILENALSIHFAAVLRLPSSIKFVSTGRLLLDLDSELERISTYWKGQKRIELAKGAILSSVSQISQARLNLHLQCSRPMQDCDIHFVPRDIEILVVESAHSLISCEAISRHFTSLTELNFDKYYQHSLSPLIHLSTLTRIKYPIDKTPLLGISFLPPSISSIELLGDKIHGSYAPYIRSQETSRDNPLPWPPALTRLVLHKYLPDFLLSFPLSQMALKELKLLGDYGTHTFNNSHALLLPTSLTSFEADTYNLTADCITSLPLKLIRFKVSGTVDCREALEYLAEKRNRIS